MANDQKPVISVRKLRKLYFQYTLPSSPPYRRLDGCSIPLLVQKFADLGFHGTHLALKCAGGYP